MVEFFGPALVTADGTYHCPCGASHGRGPLCAGRAYRCLHCGNTYSVCLPPPPAAPPPPPLTRPELEKLRRHVEAANLPLPAEVAPFVARHQTFLEVDAGVLARWLSLTDLAVQLLKPFAEFAATTTPGYHPDAQKVFENHATPVVGDCRLAAELLRAFEGKGPYVVGV
jgi:hypothetical protein